MKTINLEMFIKYDEDAEKIIDYDFADKEYTLGDVAVIVATFRRCLEDWGYEVKRIEE